MLNRDPRRCSEYIKETDTKVLWINHRLAPRARRNRLQ